MRVSCLKMACAVDCGRERILGRRPDAANPLMLLIMVIGPYYRVKADDHVLKSVGLLVDTKWPNP